MFEKTQAIARKYGSKAATGALALVGSAAAMAQEVDYGAQIVEKVKGHLSTGELIAGAVVIGLFSIWGIKLLLKGK